MTQIFLTGATGYIGGEVLHALQYAHPDYEIAALIRDNEKASKILAAFPKVRVVLADLDNTEIIEKESSKADIVIHTASNKHLESVKAIANGMAGRQNAYYIQVTGASVLAGPEIDSNSYGEPSDQIFDDLDNAADLRDMIRAYKNRRVVDNYILDLGSGGPKTAIIFPPIIFGTGKGPVNQRSVQVPSLARAALMQHVGLYLGRGLSRWGSVHIADLADLFVKLVEHAVNATPAPIWNENGLFFAENGFESFKDIALVIAKEAHSLGYIDSPDSVKSMNLDEANVVIPHGAVFLGTNGQGRALRARKLLGWQPDYESFQETARETIIAEAAQL
ncbi:NAD-dependent epimerase/dehydratase [Penicillium cf. griseofulvum]|uniref:NAD-dependent epimerase/dehydratase n=1 Tax=Penicillium cf. griseofulvum TaxID=2972120 RepID=A0A9W9MPX5_9EURO|nr:NAD-dependent epimerase/dehydratase [Penicillium cf. griseofulvum]KAJ5437525.1 NAD-dependent epimerase/dehydratase [Penicillium cf. griseofulvum]KAJ5441669.1 NAD-dependent epimerase/dehydratase [Penicillium cf. griseofulvum]